MMTFSVRYLHRVVLTVIFVTALLWSGDQETRAEVAFTIGQKLSGIVNFYGLAIPLPPGEFEVAYLKESQIRSKKYGPYLWKRLYLVKHDDRNVIQTMGIVLSSNKRKGGYLKFPSCDHKDYLFAETVKNSKGGKQDCWHIGPDAITEKWKAGKGMVKYAKEKNLGLSAVMLMSRYHFADKSWYLTVEHGTSPDLILSPFNERGFWVYDDWTAKAIEGNSTQETIMKVIRNWGAVMYQDLKAMFATL